VKMKTQFAHIKRNSRLTLLLVTILFAGAGVTEAQQPHQSATLPMLLEHSHLIVVGKVVAVDRASFGGPPRISEHDPDWRVATVEVSQTLKGDRNKRVLLVFPMSQDVAWRHNPKLSVGQTAIFILTDFESKHPLEVQPGTYYSIADSAQVHPKKALKKIKQMLAKH
jgi:hypothetical protein